MSGARDLKGGPELLEFLNQFPVKIVRNVMRGALRAGAKPIADEARASVPVKSGKLKAAIKVGSRTQAGQPVGFVRIKGFQASVGRWVEYGTAAHIIKARNGVMYFGGTYIASVDHPGARPKPFLRPALDKKAVEAVNAVGAYIAARMQIGDLSAPTLSVDEG